MASTSRNHAALTSNSPQSPGLATTDPTTRSQVFFPPSITQRNYIRRSTGHTLISSSDMSLPSLAASPTSSTLSSSPTSLLLNSSSLSLSHNTSFSSSTGVLSDSFGNDLSSSPPMQRLLSSRSRSLSRDANGFTCTSPILPVIQRGDKNKSKQNNIKKESQLTITAYLSAPETALCYERARTARQENNSMVYLDGPRIYTCGECRTHLTSHDEIISKSFHGRHGRAYLFDQCVNYTVGAAEDRRLITGLHSVCDIFCKRCKTLIGWTYFKAYEPSQKYKEGKFIIEKINLHMEESGNSYDVNHPAGERRDRWRIRAMSWGSKEDTSCLSSSYQTTYSENLDMDWGFQTGNTCSILSSSDEPQLGLANVGQNSDFDMMPPAPPKL